MREIKDEGDLSILQVGFLKAAPYGDDLTITTPKGRIKVALDELIFNGYLERNNSTASWIYCVRRTVAGDAYLPRAVRLLKEFDAGR